MSLTNNVSLAIKNPYLLHKKKRRHENLTPKIQITSKNEIIFALEMTKTTCFVD